MVKLSQLQQMFPNEQAAKEFLKNARWPQGVRCPRCDNEKVYALKARPFHWQCQNKNCGEPKDGKPNRGYRFSVITATVFENTKYPLQTWFTVAFMMLHSKKGMSALQIKRMVFNDKASYETVWYMCTRIRAALQDKEFEHLMGVVEVDETYAGGKDRNRHWNKKSAQLRKKKDPNDLDKIGFGKVGVIGAIERKGNVVCKVIGSADAPTLDSFVRRVTDKRVRLVVTDENPNYKLLGRPHDAVNHSKEEWVRGEAHTNNIESFWSLLKRGVMGSYHNVSAKYLPLYLNEFVFRFNNRNNPRMFHDAIAGC